MFHRIDDASALEGPTFLRLAYRLPAYAGVMQARATAQRDEPSSSPSQATGGYAAPQRDVNPGTRATLMAEPAFAGVFSFE